MFRSSSARDLLPSTLRITEPRKLSPVLAAMRVINVGLGITSELSAAGEFGVVEHGVDVDPVFVVGSGINAEPGVDSEFWVAEGLGLNPENLAATNLVASTGLSEAITS